MDAPPRLHTLRFFDELAESLSKAALKGIIIEQRNHGRLTIEETAFLFDRYLLWRW